MSFDFTRRAVLLGSLLLAGTAAVPAMAQDVPTLRFSAVVSDQDIRASMMNQFADLVREHANVENYFGATMFRQGTELVALQRGNLEMGNIAPQDISEQIPEWSILTSAYLFRDAAHLRTFFDSEIGEEFKAMAEDRLGIRILGPTYFGARQVGLRGDKEIRTPEDMAGIRLRMPGGDAWQFLGESLGANPNPVAYAEVYTALQTGTIDGQDNPLPNVQNMKFYEVMDQIVLTSHLVGYDLLVISQSAWDKLSPEGQEVVQAAADQVIEWSEDMHLEMEANLLDEFAAAGLNIYEPDQDAFRTYAQQHYLNSDISESWPEGALEAINAL